MGNVVWKEKQDPFDDLTKLSQYAGAYSAATIDKASEVSLLLKTKDQEISTLQEELADLKQKVTQTEAQLEQQQQMNEQLAKQWEEEKQSINQSAVHRQNELQKALEQLKEANEQLLKNKDEHIAQITAQLDNFRGNSQVIEFRKEATIVNNVLISQVKILAQYLAQAEPLCELATIVSDRVEKARDELNQADEIITAHLEWQDSKEGKGSNLPKILEVHKNILFTEWHTQVMKAERAASRSTLTSNNLIDLVNDTLYLSNIVTQCTPGKVITAHTLEQLSYPELEKTGKLIAGVNSLSIETYWHFLIKPYEQRAAIKCLTDAVQYMIPEIQDATFAAQLSSRTNKPPEIQPMLDIHHLRSKDKQPTE